jgi:hypothetical protein
MHGRLRRRELGLSLKVAELLVCARKAKVKVEMVKRLGVQDLLSLGARSKPVSRPRSQRLLLERPHIHTLILASGIVAIVILPSS